MNRFNRTAAIRTGPIKRQLAFILAIFMLLSLTVSLWQVPAARAAGKTTVTIHYHPIDGDTRAWNLWLWTDGIEGKAYPFNYKDDFGPFAVYSFDGDYDSVGFIVRTDDWEKDTDGDRFVEVKNGLGEVWIIGGDTQVYTSEPKVEKKKSIGKPGEVNVNIHYFRPMNDYKNWHLALSTKKKPVQYIPFTGDGPEGASAKVTLTGMEGDFDITYKIIHATDPSKIGTVPLEELNYAQDGITHSTTSWEQFNAYEAWFVQEDKQVYSKAEEVPAHGRIVSAAWTDTDTIRVRTNGLEPLLMESTDPTVESFVMSTGGISNPDKLTGGIPLTIRSISSETSPVTSQTAGWEIKLDKPAPIGSLTKVNIPGYGSAVVTFDRIGVSESFKSAYSYNTPDLGATFSGGSTTFKLWAPTASSVELLTYSLGDDPLMSGKAVPMNPGPSGTWSVSQTGDLNGTYYVYRTVIQGKTIYLADPFARLTNAYGEKSVVMDASKFPALNGPDVKNKRKSIVKTSVREWAANPEIIKGAGSVVITGLTGPHSILAPDSDQFSNPYDPAKVAEELATLINQAHGQGSRVVAEVSLASIQQTAKYWFDPIVPELVSSDHAALELSHPVITLWLQQMIQSLAGSWKFDDIYISGGELLEAETLKWLQDQTKSVREDATVVVTLAESPADEASGTASEEAETAEPMSGAAKTVIWTLVILMFGFILWFTFRVIMQGHNPMGTKTDQSKEPEQPAQPEQPKRWH